jgi:hypothetical protein
LITLLAVSGILYSHILFGRAGQPANAARGSLLRIARGIQEIEKIRNGRPVQFWFDRAETFGSEFNSLNSTYLWGYTMISSTFPALPKAVTLSPGVLVVVPSSRDNAVGEAVSSYKSDGQVLSLISQTPIAADGGHYSLSFFEVVTDPKTFQELGVSFDQQGNGVLSAPSQEAPAALPLERWKLSDSTTTPGVVAKERDGLHVKTPSGTWAYATIYSPLTVSTAGKYRFTLDYKLLSGQMYFGILKGDQSGWLTGVTASTAKGWDRRVECSLALHAGDKIWLLTTNGEPVTKEPSTYVIEELRAFRYVDP